MKLALAKMAEISTFISFQKRSFRIRKPKKLKNEIKHKIVSSKKGQSTKKTLFTSKQKSIENLKNLVNEDFNKRLNFAVENKLLFIEKCCENFL